MKRFSLIGLVAVLSVVVIMLFCAELPVNQSADPTNTELVLFSEKGVPGSYVIQVNRGDSLKIGLSMVYPRHLETIRITTSCDVFKNTITPDTGRSFDTIYFTPKFTTEGPCTVFVNAPFIQHNLKDLTDTLAFYVSTGEPGVDFSAVPQAITIRSGKADTLLFVTTTKGGAGNLVYAMSASPALGTTQLDAQYSSKNDSVRVICNPSTADTYTVTLIATADRGEIVVKDTASVKITVVNPLKPSKVDAPQTLVAGTTDTLMFTVDNSTRIDKLTMKLVTETPLDPSVFTVLPTGSDSLLIAVSPATTATTGTVKIGICTSNGMQSDTSWHPVLIVNQNSAIWNTTEVAVTAPEGKPVQQDLRSYLITPLTGPVSFATDKGTVADTVWKWTPTYGCAASTAATVTAIKGTSSFELKLAITVTPGDTIRPTLQLLDSTLDRKMVGSSQIIVGCIAKDIESGVGSVKITDGSITIDALVQNEHEGKYSGVVTGLPNGIPTQITITATDKSMQKNKEMITFTVTYDSMKLTTEPTTITLNLAAATPVNEGSCLTLKVEATGTPTPAFNWYKDDAPLAGQTATELSKTNVTASDAGSYYVVVSNGVGTSITSTKTVVMVKLKATITEDPVAVTVNDGGSATFKVKATGEPTLTYQWLKDGQPFSGSATATLTINAAATTDDGTKFSCVVSNTFSKDTSTEALMIVKPIPEYSVMYDKNGGMGNVPIDSKKYKTNEKVTVLENSTLNGLSKLGYKFIGWNTKTDGSGTLYNPNTQFTINSEDVMLYATWIVESYTITYHLDGGINGNNPATFTSESSTIALNNALKKSYIFDGWYSNSSKDPSSQVMVIYSGSTGNKELWAKWVIKDMDNNIYTEITLGNQVWMVENLKTTRYNDSSTIQNIIADSYWDGSTEAAYCWYENNAGKSHGALYNWYVVNTGKLAPKGWHVPTSAEWDELVNYVASAGEQKLTEGGFMAQLGGLRGLGGYCSKIDTNGYWWSTTEETLMSSGYDAYHSFLSMAGGIFEFSASSYYFKRSGLSVRCIRDNQ